MKAERQGVCPLFYIYTVEIMITVNEGRERVICTANSTSTLNRTIGE